MTNHQGQFELDFSNFKIVGIVVLWDIGPEQ